jgi:hypothetical protein
MPPEVTQLLAEFVQAVEAERRARADVREQARRIARFLRALRAAGVPSTRVVDVAAINRLRTSGRSWRQIAQALRVPRRTIERAFKV